MFLGFVTFVRKIGFKIIHFFVPELGHFSNGFVDRKYKYENEFILNHKTKLGYCAENAIIEFPILVTKPENIYLYENSAIYHNSTFLIVSANFIMKKNSVAAQGFTVVTGNHTNKIGSWYKDLQHIEDVEKDVVVEEDVWIGTNVTLLAGVTIGRGAIVGAGAVCRKSVPPYAIVLGNPAKVVGFKFRPDEILEHEKLLYTVDERYSIDILNKNYNKFFLQTIEGINDYLKLNCT